MQHGHPLDGAEREERYRPDDDGVKADPPAKVSDAGLRALRGLHFHDDATVGISGRAAYGGLNSTLESLRRKGLVEGNGRGGWQLTDAGRERAQQ